MTDSRAVECITAERLALGSQSPERTLRVATYELGMIHRNMIYAEGQTNPDDAYIYESFAIQETADCILQLFLFYEKIKLGHKVFQSISFEELLEMGRQKQLERMQEIGKKRKNNERITDSTKIFT